MENNEYPQFEELKRLRNIKRNYEIIIKDNLTKLRVLEAGFRLWKIANDPYQQKL